MLHRVSLTMAMKLPCTTETALILLAAYALCAPQARADCPTLTCNRTNATGYNDVAIGWQTTASGSGATAMGAGTTANGQYATAMGCSTTASGNFATAMGYETTASGGTAVAMGDHIEAKEDESLVVSGNVHAKNVQLRADARLAANVTLANNSELLQTVRQLEVVEHSKSANYCSHLGLTAEQCSQERTLGLLAQQVAQVAPKAVSTGSSLRLVKPRPKQAVAKPVVELEAVEQLQSLDVHVVLAQLVGAVQEQAKQNEEQAKQIEEQAKQIEEQAKQIQMLLK